MLSESLIRLPDEAYVWIYAFDEQLNSEQETAVRNGLNRFIADWNSHGQRVEGCYQINEKRFVFVAGHCANGISGCSIDSKVRVFKDLHDRFGLNALGGTRVFYRDANGHIHAAERKVFREMVRTGEIDKKTPIFDLTTRTIQELRTLPFEQPFGESWAAKMFDGSEKESAA